MTILCRCENIETSEGVPLFVTGVAQVITHLLPPLCLTFSLPALWGLARRIQWTPLLRVCLPPLCFHFCCSGSSAKISHWVFLDAKPKLGVGRGRKHRPLCDRAELSGWGGFSPSPPGTMEPLANPFSRLTPQCQALALALFLTRPEDGSREEFWSPSPLAPFNLFTGLSKKSLCHSLPNSLLRGL